MIGLLGSCNTGVTLRDACESQQGSVRTGAVESELESFEKSDPKSESSKLEKQELEFTLMVVRHGITVKKDAKF